MAAALGKHLILDMHAGQASALQFANQAADIEMVAIAVIAIGNAPTALFQLPSCPRPAFPVTMPSPPPPPADGEFAFPPAMLMLMVEALKPKEASKPEATETVSKVFSFI